MTQFKLNDRVKVINDNHAYTRSVGRIGRITDIAGYVYAVRFDDGIDAERDTAYADDLQLFKETVVTTSVKEKLAAIENLVSEIKDILGQ